MKVEYRYMTREEFWPLYEEHEVLAFGNERSIDLMQFLSEEEKEKQGELNKMLNISYRLYLTAWVDDKLAGWSWGYQRSRHEYYMCNSAVLPEYRKKKIYTTMLSMIVEKATVDGFQEIVSNHHSCNNDVIIPKLKYGFFISGQVLDPCFGNLISMVYFANKKIEFLYQQRIGFRK